MIERYETRHNRPPLKHGEKFCMKCKTGRPAAGGITVVSPDKSRQQWHCSGCRKDNAAELRPTPKAVEP